MDKAIKQKNKKMLTAIILTLCLPLGIGMTIGGAIKGMGIVLGIGIALIVAGFYGAPVAWSTMANSNKMIRLLSGIEQKNLYTVKELSTYINASEKVTINLIRQAEDKGYISDYLFVDNDRLELIKSRKQSLGKVSFKCDNCGALVYADQKDSQAQCEYCGKVFGGEYIDKAK